MNNFLLVEVEKKEREDVDCLLDWFGKGTDMNSSSFRLGLIYGIYARRDPSRVSFGSGVSLWAPALDSSLIKRHRVGTWCHNFFFFPFPSRL